MFEVIGLILPVFAVIVAGYAAKRTGFLADGFWAPAEKLGYWVLLPSLIIQGLGTNKLPADWTIFAAAIAATVVPLSLVMLARGGSRTGRAPDSPQCTRAHCGSTDCWLSPHASLSSATRRSR